MDVLCNPSALITACALLFLNPFCFEIITEATESSTGGSERWKTTLILPAAPSCVITVCWEGRAPETAALGLQ